jgi:GGDEF domain-containing protein
MVNKQSKKPDLVCVGVGIVKINPFVMVRIKKPNSRLLLSKSNFKHHKGMSMTSPSQSPLYRSFWTGTWAAVLMASLGGWLAQPIMWLETSVFLLLQLTITIICARNAVRFPEIVGAVQMLLGLMLNLGFMVIARTTWEALGVGGVIYGILAAPFALGIAFIWGWAGMTLNLAVVFILILLPSNRPEPRILGSIIMLLNGVLGWILQGFFQSTEARHRELERSVSTDALTQIGNRRALLEDFPKFQSAAQEKGLPLLLTSWDLDGLKRINDRKGHQAGDEYILGFVAALQEAVRDKDGLYRTGGDEFVALHLGLANGGKLYERVRTKFPSVSGGWSRASHVTLDQALTEADVQMYAEKRAHKAVITSVIGESQTR